MKTQAFDLHAINSSSQFFGGFDFQLSEDVFDFYSKN